MKELFWDFWTKKSAATRAIRLLFNIVGAIAASGEVPLPPAWMPWVRAFGAAALIAGPLITGYSQNVAEEAAKNTG